MIRVTNLKFGFNENPLLLGVNFVVNSGEKVALVGQNGSGKSTLFKILTYRLSPDEGNLEITESVDFVPQEIKSDPTLDHAPTIRHFLNQFGSYPDFEILPILSGLDLKVSLDQVPSTLSGGQKTRLLIARALLLKPDILLLDEPTNFLDQSGKRWIMDFLAKYPKTLIMVSHDIDLLDKNIDKVLYVNPQTKSIDVYTGNYSKFLELKKKNEDLLRRKIMAETKHIAQMKKGLTKMKYTSEKGIRQRLNLERRIAKLEASLPQMPREAAKIKLVLPAPSWVGQMPILIKNISKSFGDKQVLKNLNFDLKRGERISLEGVNGAGKSTLIKIIMGLLPSDSGEVILDPKIKIGYYSQEFEQFDPDDTLFNFLRQKSDLTEGAIRSILGKMLFVGDKIFQKIGTLSGGEKTRLAISALLVQDFNVLILDEPTTYLDPLSQRLILEALKTYQGAMLVVSHTPEFISELNPPRIYTLPAAKFRLTSSQI